MKHMIQATILLLAVFLVNNTAYADFFEYSHLVLTVYHPEDNEVGVDLIDLINMKDANGDQVTLDSSNRVLASAGTVYIGEKSGQAQFGTSVSRWRDLRMAVFDAYDDTSGNTHYLFATTKGTPPEVNPVVNISFKNGSNGIHRLYDDLNVQVYSGSSSDRSSFYNKMDLGSTAYGQMAGYNTYDWEDGVATLEALEISGGYQDMYLYEFDEGGNVVSGTIGDYKAVIRLNADGSVILNPTSGNTAPTIELKRNGTILGSSVSISEGESLTVVIEAADEDGDTITLTSPSASSLPTGATLSDAVTSGGTSQWTFSWTPGSDQANTYQLTFSVSDGTASKSEQLSIVVTDVNQAPSVSVTGTDTVNEGTEMTLVIAATDADGDELSMTDISLPDGAVLSEPAISGSTYQWTFSWTPDYTQAGTYSFDFTVTDGSTPVTNNKTLTVGNTNQVPVLDEIQSSYTLADPTTALEISISAQDEDQVGLLLGYTLVSHDTLPGTVNVSDPVVDSETGEHTWTFDWTPGSGVADVYTLNFSVTEASGESPLTSKVSQVVVTVGDGTNAPPVLAAIGAQEIVEGVVLSIQMAATDTEGQTLTYSVDYPVAMPADHNAQLDESTGLFTWTPRDGDGSEENYTYDLTFRVTDDGTPSQSDEEVVAVTVYANQLPSDPSLNQPEDGGQVNATQAVGFSVNNASDADTAKGQTLRYHFQLYSASDMASGSLLAETDPYLTEEEDGTTEWVTPATLTLEENQTYYWRCRVFDGIAYSQWVDGSFTVNSGNEAPGTPTRVSPLEGAVLKTLTPELLVQNANDPDGDTLQYIFQIGTSENIESSSGFQSATVDEGNNHSGTGNTSWIVASALDDNSTYWWRVKAQDSSGSESDWIGPYSFNIDLTSEGPSAPELDASLSDQSIYGGEVTTDTPRLIVGNATDPDADDSLTYYFEIIEDTGDGCGVYEGETLMQSSGIPEGQMEASLPADDEWDSEAGDSLPQDPDHTAWRTPALNDNTQYCWRAWAEDEQGNIGPAVESSLFVNLENDTPTACTIKSPVNGSEVSVRMPTLVVNAATDLDGDRISYQFVLTDETGTITYTQILHSKTSWQVPESLTDGVWYWQVKTFDEHADEDNEPSRWSEKVSFTLDINDLPGKPSIYSPTSKQTVTTLQPVLVVTNATDQDGDALSYEFELYNDASLAAYSFVSSKTVAQGTNVTSWQITKQLTDGMTYYWRVRAFDGEYYSGWTKTSEFSVNLAGGMIVNIEASQQILADSESEQVVAVLIEDSPIYGVRVRIPSGALTDNITVTIGYAQNPPASDGFTLVGKVLEFGPSGTTFSKPVTIEIPYTQEDLDAAGVTAPDELKILNYNEDEETWEEIAITSVDQDNYKILCSVDHFSLYFLGASEDSETHTSDDSSSGGGGGGCFVQTLKANATPTDSGRSGAGMVMMLLITAGIAGLLADRYRRLRD